MLAGSERFVLRLYIQNQTALRFKVALHGCALVLAVRFGGFGSFWRDGSSFDSLLLVAYAASVSPLPHPRLHVGLKEERLRTSKTT